MSFSQSVKAKLLIKCHRRCCICHKLCGVNIEVNHIIPEADGGSNGIGNAIPLCFECHTEVGHYNPDHPKGNKYTPEELRGHKEEWFNICETYPQALISAPKDRDVGPLEGLLQELSYNQMALNIPESPVREMRSTGIGVTMNNTQYERALTEGALLLLPENVKNKIISAYIATSKVNVNLSAFISTRPTGNNGNTVQNRLLSSIRSAQIPTKGAKEKLEEFLNPNNG